ncbi:hypothetical protein AC578_917 [Pseudocercospora eumusae]|uniref:F-box domain-containing protein n=1 Tax=Pseudocercospora eumusae TaxID=321146 RepID=A0A139HBS4_9PEZI|nr:hypothetical protein AC578_917 [Pseudocercospora eumusae]
MDTRSQAERDAARDAVRDRVINTAELLDMILSYITDPIEMISLRVVNKAFCGAIDASNSLAESFLFIQKKSMVLPGPTMDAMYQKTEEVEEWVAKGLYNTQFLGIGTYCGGYDNAPYRYETEYGIKHLPRMVLDYDDKAQEGTLYVQPDDPTGLPSSTTIGLRARMFFTSHPIPVLRVEFLNRNCYGWTYHDDADYWERVEIKLKNPRLGEVLDICWRLRKIASIREKRMIRLIAEKKLRKSRRQEKKAWGGDDEDEVEEVEKCTCAPGKYCFQHWDWKDEVEEELLKICINRPEVDGKEI